MKRSELPKEGADYIYSWLPTLSVKRPRLNPFRSRFSVYDRLFAMNHLTSNSKSITPKSDTDPFVEVDFVNPTLDSTILHPAPLSNYGQVSRTISTPSNEILPDGQKFVDHTRTTDGPSNSTVSLTSSDSHLLDTDLHLYHPRELSGFERQVYQRLLSEAALAERLDSLDEKARFTTGKKITIVIDDTNDKDTRVVNPVSTREPTVSTALARSDQSTEKVTQQHQLMMTSTMDNSETACTWLRRCEETPYLSDAWLKSLSGRRDTETRRRDFDRQLAEAKLSHFSKQVAMSHRQRMDSLEQRLACLLLTPSVLNDPYLEPQPIPIELPYKSSLAAAKAIPPTALPVLTEAQLASVEKVMKAGPLDQVLVENFRLAVTRRELLTLAGTNWLSDMVINFYMQLLLARSHQQPLGRENKADAEVKAVGKRPSVCRRLAVLSTFFYSKLTSPSGGGYPGVRRWSRQLKLFDQELVLVPIHDRGMHWCLAGIDMVARAITYYDSMGSSNVTCLRTLKQYLQDEHVDKKGTPLPDPDTWKLVNPEDTVPQQFNGSDCGVFMCTFGEFLSRGAAFNFSQDDMPGIRQRMTLEILNQQLLTTDFHLVANGK